ncbi:alpha/beta fold hydrolase [Amantichitinum ursilacus]|uniref:3-oxoadipate enol-lactonase 2 n=1 Tax=Amantichitinum ursilacus TaxID=857265 RepID=A0A0N0XGD3_9NEIS|nr:alpha/beta hydrolase [Amantichitinum ursilacus]KPC49942.1 3-oxoadipate enol-lactonase 2 [Amantichitinum ursilacus]
MPRAQLNPIELEYQTFGQPEDTPVLLIMGLGMQLLGWPEEFCRNLARAGYYVIRYDNRDVGLSSKLEQLGRPPLLLNMLRHSLGWKIPAPYTLDDMAEDAIGLLDTLGIARAHVVGASMGGMIAQLVVTHAPERALSLTSIMSTTSAPGLPGPTVAARACLTRRPPRKAYLPEQRELMVEFMLNNLRVLQSPGFPMADEIAAARIRESLDRSLYPAGVLRQLLAVVSAPDRSTLLQQIKTPSLVVHGVDDPLIPLAAGQDTADKIPGARFVAVHGMAHDLAPGVCARLEALMLPHFAAAEDLARSRITATAEVIE